MVLKLSSVIHHEFLGDSKMTNDVFEYDVYRVRLVDRNIGFGLYLFGEVVGGQWDILYRVTDFGETSYYVKGPISIGVGTGRLMHQRGKPLAFVTSNIRILLLLLSCRSRNIVVSRVCAKGSFFLNDPRIPRHALLLARVFFLDNNLQDWFVLGCMALHTWLFEAW